MRTNRIAFLLVVIAIAAVGFAAFRSAGRPWASLAASAPMLLLIAAPSAGSTKSGRWPYFVLWAVGFMFWVLPWPIDDFSSHPNWLEARIDGLFHAIDPEERPRPIPPRLIADRKPRCAVTLRELQEKQAADYEHFKVMNEWSFARDRRAISARRIAHAWLALTLGGAAALAAGFFRSRPSPGPSDRGGANRRRDGGVPAEVPMTADPGSASLADVEL